VNIVKEKNLMSTELIQSLIPHLPRYPEGEGDFYSVPHQVNRAIAKNTVALIENLFEIFAVLNPVYLQKGEWRSRQAQYKGKVSTIEMQQIKAKIAALLTLA
jgi:hypothetical protein